MVGVNVHFLSCRYPVVPAPCGEQTFPLNYFKAFVVNQVSMYVWVYYFPLIFLSTFMPELPFLDNYNFILSLGIR